MYNDHVTARKLKFFILKLNKKISVVSCLGALQTGNPNPHSTRGIKDNVLCSVYNHLYRNPPTKLKKNRERELYLVIYSEPIFIK